MKVSVYRNLNKRDGVWYSIKRDGKVIDYRQFLVLHNCTFKHPTRNALTRIRSKHREVCSWINGWLDDSDPTLPEVLNDVLDSLTPIACDPKQVDYFTNSNTKERIDQADLVLLNEKGCFACQTTTALSTNGKSTSDLLLIKSSNGDAKVNPTLFK